MTYPEQVKSTFGQILMKWRLIPAVLPSIQKLIFHVTEKLTL